MEFVGKTVKKEVKGVGIVSGTVKSYDASSGFVEILYEDGDSEELELSDVASLLEFQPELAGSKTRVGRKPQKRRRVVQRREMTTCSGNVSENLVAGSEFRGVLDSNDSTSGNGGNLIGNVNGSVNANGSVEKLGKEIGFGFEENLNKDVSANNGNSVKDGIDLNARLNLNEDINLNDVCGSSPFNDEGSLERRDCIDLNLDVSNEDDVNLGGETLRRECKFDLNVEVCEEVKEAQGDADRNGRFKVDASVGETGQLREEEANVSHRSMEDDGVRGNVNCVSDAVKLEGIQVSVEHMAKDASLCLIEEKESHDGKEDVVAIESLRVSISNAISDRDRDYVSLEVQQTDCPSGAGFSVVHEYQDDPGSPCKQGNSQRKRIKISGNLKATPDLNATPDRVLRRSSRRASARKRVSSAVLVQVTDDPLSSLGTRVTDDSLSSLETSVTEEKPLMPGTEKYEQCNVPLPKLQLPPSSENLNLDHVPVLELFSVYACLRSFSTLLFLSPFELEDLVAAVKSEIPSVLFDSIHVSILQTLRKHLEFLSNEGCQSASICLRNLNWDFLDLITWPMFMAEYLLIHGSGFKTSFDANHLMVRTDYYKQPAILKLEILQYLCDDMIEAEAIRSELNRRSLVTETGMGFDQNIHFDICKKRKAVMDVSGGSCLSEEIMDDATDCNSDECCLCKMDGNLICCDGCPAAFHSRCVGIASDNLPEGDWYCPECAIGTHGASMKSRRSLRGADLLGIDPDGRHYFDSCGYLLVSNSPDAGSLFNYYHRNDLHVVIEVLKSMDTIYGDILMAIYKHWDIPADSSAGVNNLAVFNQSSCKNMQMTGGYNAMHTSLAPFTSETCMNKNQADDQRKLEKNSTIDCCTDHGEEFPKAGNRLDSVTTIESPFIPSEGSADTAQMRSGIENVQMHRLYDSNGSYESLNQSGLPEKPIGDGSLTSFRLDVGRKIKLRSIGVSSMGNENTLQAPCGTDYINYYSFAWAASLIAQEFMYKLAEKINKNIVKTEEEIISDQAKAIMKKSSNFCWPSIENLNAAAQKEICGWCFACKVANDDRDCLYNSVVKPLYDVSKGTSFGLQPRKIQNGHLREIICHIFSLEVRLRGLLLGPWLNLHQTNLWHKDLLKTSDFLPVKRLLLLLESNLRHRALSPDWLKHVDSVATMGSATHIVVSSSRTSSKHAIGRKKARYSDIESSSSSNTTGGLGMYWWRGGCLSRKLFNWKVLPRSLVTKAARQGGCTKIPGVLYPENSDFAKRSRCVAWRAAVEMSTSVEQLALQVRELYSNIRWYDIENSHPLYVLDKESRKSVRLFKKVIVRRKCADGQSVKYLLDFGKRRAIPDIVIRHGSLLEQPSSERKTYWLNESYVPLHLLKNFEEKRIIRKSNDNKLGKILEIGRVKRVSQQRGFSYLFSRMERSGSHQCGHCKRDVPIREAVSCLYCKGHFHKRHVRKSGGTRATECTYSCHRCQDGLHVKTNTNRSKVESKLQKIQSRKCKNVPVVCKSVNLKGNKKASSKVRQVRSQNNKKILSSVPLRRSTRKAKSLYLHSQMIGGRRKGMQSKKNVGRKKGKQSKFKKVTSQKPKDFTGQHTKVEATTARKKRTKLCNSYWLNGLWLSRKPNDERVTLFKEKKHIISFKDFSGSLDCPKCCLCCGNGRTSNYIACEICGDWFHGDAFGLTVENARQLIGFRCHVCRDRAAPICPHMKINALSCTESNAAIECAD